MSRDVLTVGSTMRIPLLYRGEYSQWVERFMNYLEEQTDGEAMINSIKNGDQPLPRVTQVSIARTISTEQPPLKDKSMWKTKEKIVPYPRFISLLLEHMAPKYDNEEFIINPTQVFSVHNWILKPNQPEEPPFTDHMKAICNVDMHVDSKAPKYSSPTDEVPKAKSLELEVDSEENNIQNTHLSPPLRHPNPNLAFQKRKLSPQAAGGPTSLGDTSKDGAHPQLSSGHDASIDFTAKADPEDLADILKDTRSTFFTPDSSTDEPIIISDNIQWELLAEFLDLPHLASSVQEKLKTLDSLLGLLKTVTNTLNRLATLVENASGATTTGVPSADRAAALPAKGKKDADTNLKIN
nr:hypothetical protein [Tanacetum cinerariifolium]